METSIGIGERLREERESLNLNQESFAQLAKATRQTQSNYEKGSRSPDTEYLYAISLAGADIQYIITGMRTTPAAPVDTDLLRQVIEGVEYALDNNNLTLSTVYKSKLIALLYEQFSENKQVEQAVINRFLQASNG
ncbi:MAG: helix-turn-helix transcriptional regulator [Oxalobacteraceae bacterium]|nr:helix-turn-helix transcriptional regulator [Oxalobacteraceae bacterium]